MFIEMHGRASYQACHFLDCTLTTTVVFSSVLQDLNHTFMLAQAPGSVEKSEGSKKVEGLKPYNKRLFW